MRERNEQVWECANADCGQQIQFLMLGKTTRTVTPTCFCGGRMKKYYVKPHLRKCHDISASTVESPGPAAPGPHRELRFSSRRTMECLLPGSGVR